MAYDFFEILHISSLFCFLAAFTISLYDQRTRWRSMCMGIFGMLLLISGILMLGDLAISADLPLPLWIKLLLVLWLVLMIVSAVLLKRAQWPKIYSLSIVLSLVVVSTAVVIFQP